MSPLLRNILAVLAGIVGGSVVNVGLVETGHAIFPPGIDTQNLDDLGAFLLQADLKYFLFPFLAHAGGTFVGAALTAFLAASKKKALAMGLGVFFLLGGIAAVTMIDAPMWFSVVDLLLAYIPMAWLGGNWGSSLRPEEGAVAAVA